MMSNFQQAINMNNQGIGALLEGNQRYAIQSLTMATRLIKVALHNEAEERYNATTSSSLVAANGSNINQLPPQAGMVTIPRMESSDTIVFNQAIQIPTGTTAPAVEEEQPQSFLSSNDMNIYSAAIIYNLALTHQSIGQTSYLNKAEKMYCLVLQLLHDIDITTSAATARRVCCCSQHTLTLLKLGCINNLSQIRYSNGDYDKAQDCRSYAMENIRDEALLFNEEPNVLALLMNVLMIKKPVVASAA